MQRAERSIRVNAPVHKVYEYWHNFENFPRFMEHVQAVQVRGGNKKLTHWTIKGPLGTTWEYDAELTRDEPGKEIAWNSTGGDFETSGTVTFRQVAADTTEVHVLMQWYDTPGGAVGEAASRTFQNPEKMLEEDLQRFKDIAEGRVGSGTRRD